MTAADYAFLFCSVVVALGVGVVIGYRRGVRRTWLTAALAFVLADRVVMAQLRRAEDVAVTATEREHDLIQNAPYRSQHAYDSPNRKQPRTEVQGHPTARSTA